MKHSYLLTIIVCSNWKKVIVIAIQSDYKTNKNEVKEVIPFVVASKRRKINKKLNKK